MNEKSSRVARFGVLAFAVSMVALGLSGQAAAPVRKSLVTDWSSRHLIFSTPTTREGLALALRDPRYQQQWTRRNMRLEPPTDGEGSNEPIEVRREAAAELGATLFKLGSGDWGRGGSGGSGGNGNGKLHRDWMSSLGPGGTAGSDTYPAKFNFNTSTASCANDFVVFGTSQTGAAAGATATGTGTFSSTGPANGQAATLTYGSGASETVTATAATDASATGTFTGNPNSTQTATIGGTLALKGMPGGQITVAVDPTGGDTLIVGSTTYTFHMTCTTAPCIVHSGNTTQDATNIVEAIKDTCGSAANCIVSAANTSVTAASSTNVVTLTALGSPAVNAYTLVASDTTSLTIAIGARGTGSNTLNNFVIGVTNGSTAITNDATSLAATIAAQGGGVGVTATSSGATVTVTATTAGTGGNSIALAEGLSNFTWSGMDLSGGAALQGGSNFFAITNATGTALTLTQIASNFATAVAAEATANGVPVTASSSGAGVTVTSSVPGSLGNGVTLAETLSNFAWSGGTLAGGVGQASIVAYNNLYSSCGGTVPSTFWSYFTNGTVQTSPTLSIDGTQVAFVQSSSGGVASLVLLKWKSASVTAGSPVTLTTTTASAYPGCTAPCMLTLTFNGSPNDTNSSPYYDYSSDTLYVGDDNGSLHKFTPVFNGTPAEITTGGWPAALTNSSGRMTSSPVAVSGGSVYIGSAHTGFGGGTGGYFYSVNESTGAVTASSQIATIAPGIADAPIVDPVAGMVYVFSGSDTSEFTCGFFTPCAGVFQFATNFAAGNGGTEQQVGTGGNAMFTGDFDNIYYSSSDPPTGSLYVCGDSGGNATIYRIPITSNSMGTPVAGPVISSAEASCSPITEVDNGTTDLIFLNVVSDGSPSGCGGGGCVMSFAVTSGTLAASSTPTATLPENGGASGMIIDTLGSGTTGANQVYLTPLGTGQTCPSAAGCAIQASQSSLN